MAAGDLTTVADVLAFLQLPDDDQGIDALLQTLITAASKAFATYTRREFTPTDAATRVFRYLDQGGFLSFDPYDLREATTVVLDSDLDPSEQATLASSDYQLRPLPPPDGVYRWMLIDSSFAKTQDREREVSITGNWGFADVPADVAQWCVVTVATWYRRDAAAFSETFNVDEGHLERPEALPSAVRGGLARYQRTA